VVPVEIGYDRLKQLQYDNLSHFKDIESIYNGMVPQASLEEKCVYIGLLLCIFCVITMLYYIQ
jgi:hypothetical protein